MPSSRVAWGLDRLGNWTEAADGYEGRVEHEDLDGSAGYEALVLAQDHTTDLRNELTGIDIDIGNGPVSTPHIHDAAGNLVADGVYYYQYDAFNRIAAVYELNDLTFDAAGVPNGGEPGDWRAKYAYDALGRRVCKQVPWHTGDARMAWYYYDGVRRVQEVFRDPLPPGSLAGNPNPIGSYTTYTDREYVWGPGYVDECLWQIDRTGAAAFVLQDANFNVVALIDDSGQVLQQFDYDPYGSVLALDEPAAYAGNRIGFQGLFADRFDADAPHPEMAVGADQTYYARNRDYMPDLGRWMQRDPNGSASFGIHSSRRWGDTLDYDLARADLQRTYGDGANLFSVFRCSPVFGNDPLGLYLIPETMGSAMRVGLNAYGRADTANGVLDLAKALASGATITSALVGLAADYAMDKAGGKLFEKVLDSAKSLRKAIAKGDVPGSPPARALEGDFDTYVYLGFDVETHAITYVGVTNNLPRRSQEHSDRDFEVAMTFGPFPRLMARALEQEFIVQRRLQKDGGTLQNKRNEIAESREFFDELVTKWAVPMVKALGY